MRTRGAIECDDPAVNDAFLMHYMAKKFKKFPYSGGMLSQEFDTVLRFLAIEGQKDTEEKMDYESRMSEAKSRHMR